MEKDNIIPFPKNKTFAGLKIPIMLTIEETARVTGRAKHYIRELAINKKIVHTRSGKKYLINLEKFIEYENTNFGCEKEDTEELIANKFNLKPVKA